MFGKKLFFSKSCDVGRLQAIPCKKVQYKKIPEESSIKFRLGLAINLNSILWTP